MSTSFILLARQVVAILFIAGSLLSLTVAFLAGRRWSQPIWRYLALLMLANAVWGWGDALEILAHDPSVKQFWLVFAYFGRMPGPPLLLTFALYFSHQEAWLRSKWRVAALWMPGLIALPLAMTDSWHRLIWTSITVDPVTFASTYIHGPYFFFVATYSYILLTAAVVVFLRAVWHLRAIYRQQALVLIFASLLPIAANILYLTPFNPLQGVDQTAFAFGFTGLLLLWGISRLQLIDLRPFYREVLIEHMTEGVLVLSPEGHVIDLNPAAKSLARMQGQLIGCAAKEVFPEVIAAIQDCGSNQTCRVELSLDVTPPKHLDVTVTPLQDASGAYRGREVVWRDITALRQAEAQMLQDERTKAVLQLRGQIAQELQDNLGHVLSYVSTNAEVIHNLIQQGEYAAALARVDALRLAAAEANLDIRRFVLEQQASEVSTLDFTGALRQYLERFEALSGLHIQATLPEEGIDTLLPGPVLIPLLQILQETLTNVHKHAAASSAQVIFAQTPEAIQMIITDDGVEFEPQEAASKGTSGLDSIRQRAAEAGATLRILSAPGQGNQVIVTFLRPKPDLVQEQLQGWKVLLVDDHPLFLEGLQDLLQSRGMQVVGVAEDGEEGVRLAEELGPNLVLMDVRMPRLAGPEAVRQIKSRLPQTRVVMLTMATDERALTDSLAAGANGYLLKTQPTEEILRALVALTAGQIPLAPELIGAMTVRMAQTVDQPVSAEQTLHSAGLSTVQVEVLRRLAQGMVYKQVANDLSMSESAIKYHVERILTLLNLPGRSQAIAYATQIGLAPLSDASERP